MSAAKILIVDDEPFLAQALTFVLSKEGYEISIASDGDEALRQVSLNKPQVIFLDIMMPKKNGYEVCEIIKNSPDLKDIYVIMLSAKGWESDRAKGLSLGANDFITKPYSPKDVVGAAKKAIESLALANSL